ncbi:hypothetical protein IWQ60_001478 [Tieghemiomyces parasiticus]|uniref:NADPH--cytochrome P450 reductase n=1 Tax=Tieghemiomyces parasiticus TaxID=78921 RepID=A0A9W8AGY2_9FUNG|nr:hypothetical protein IWQ60_001478 [Tieghemiomyces parasiticus]
MDTSPPPNAPTGEAASVSLEFSDYLIIFIALAAAGFYLLRRQATPPSTKSPFDRLQESARAETKTAALPKARDPTKGSDSFVTLMREAGQRMVFFYGSQTGTAEDFARRLAKEATQRFGLRCLVADLEEHDLTVLHQLPRDHLAVFLLATYGEGEPTDNAVEFWETLINPDDEAHMPEFTDIEDPDDHQPLRSLHYALFGLGNSTYELYNHVARTVDQTLERLGAQRVHRRGEGDDDRSMEEDFLAWKDELWPLACAHFGIDFEAVSNAPQAATFDLTELPGANADHVYDGGPIIKPAPSGLVPTYDVKHPYWAPVALTRELFTSTERSCLHVELDISDAQGMTYLTGDHAAVWPVNPEREVDRLLNVLGLADRADTAFKLALHDPNSASSKQAPFPVPTTYRTALRHCLDIISPPSRQFFETLTAYARSEPARTYLGTLASDKAAYARQIFEPRLTMGEVLEIVQRREKQAIPTVAAADRYAIPFAALLDEFTRVLPRYYSISSSAKLHPKRLHMTAVVLAYTPTATPDRTVYGVATNYFKAIHDYRTRPALTNGDAADRAPLVTGDPAAFFLRPKLETGDLNVAMFVRRSNFKLPKSPATPVIMVGPGTGVAPFRAFVMERSHLAATSGPDTQVGPTLLYFGCRSRHQDYLYEPEWPEYFQHLPAPHSGIRCAFSRDQPEKIYVQDLLRAEQDTLWDLLHNHHAYVYVCGDARHMARDVNKTFVDIAANVGGMPQQQAVNYVKNLRGQGRYQEDVWA